ncbi:T9SS type A sorting domain-containing protein, partial [Arthrospira platensis SPKY1]|nr:T9SS type A sorting domain-containing protein [Arthrospira platensis SPKY1]
PNPATNYTIISYHLPESSDVEIRMADVNGQLIQTQINEAQTAGKHQLQWDTNHLPTGVYYYTLKTGNAINTQRCVIIK